MLLSFDSGAAMKNCEFCHREELKEYIIDEDRSKGEFWYAFIPRDIEIFGHVILTTDKGDCIHDLHDVDDEILQAEIVGV